MTRKKIYLGPAIIGSIVSIFATVIIYILIDIKGKQTWEEFVPHLVYGTIFILLLGYCAILCFRESRK